MSRSIDRRPPYGMVFGTTMLKGVASDSSTYRIAAGTLNGNAAISGGKVSLDGAGDWVGYGDHAHLSFGTNPFSLVAKVNFPSVSGFHTILSKRSGSAGSNKAEWLFYASGGKPGLSCYRHDQGAAEGVISTNVELTDATDHVVCITWAATGSAEWESATIYVDGVSVATSRGGYNQSSYTGMTNTTIPFLAGREDGTPELFMTGDLGEHRVYNRELTALEAAIICQEMK